MHQRKLMSFGAVEILLPCLKYPAVLVVKRENNEKIMILFMKSEVEEHLLLER